jgi:hypothetical protein
MSAVGVLKGEPAAGLRQAQIGRQLLLDPSERRDLEASVHEVERPGPEAALEQVVVRERDVGEALLADQGPRRLEQLVVHVGAGHRASGPHPCAQDAEPAEAPAAHVQGAEAVATPQLAEKGPPGRLLDARLELQPLELRGLAREQIAAAGHDSPPSSGENPGPIGPTFLARFGFVKPDPPPRPLGRLLTGTLAADSSIHG